MSLKYNQEIRSIRKNGKKQILKILTDKPHSTNEIIDLIKEKNQDLYDDSIKCECIGGSETTPEWQHQLRWAIQDLKYQGKLTFDPTTRKYKLKES